MEGVVFAGLAVPEDILCVTVEANVADRASVSIFALMVGARDCFDILLSVQARILDVTLHDVGGVSVAPPVPFLEGEVFDSHSGFVAKCALVTRKTLTDEG